MTERSRTASPGLGQRLTPGVLSAPVVFACIAASVALLAGAAGLDQGSGNARSLAIVLPALALGLSAAVVCLPDRLAGVVVLVGAVLVGPVRGLLYDPARDAACTRCLPSPYAVFPDQSLADAAAAAGGAMVVAGLVIAAVRHRNFWAAVAAVAAGYSVTAYATPHGLRVGAVWAMLVLAVTRVAVAKTRLSFALNAVARLTEDLRSGRSPDAVLRTHLADPTARVDFVAPAPDRSTLWVTAEGELANDEGAASTHEHTTLVYSGGRPVARLHHSGATVNVTPELALVMEQAGLEAGLAHQVAELEKSRRRVVQVADSERRQLERDLHDGAQQYLLALAFELSLIPPEVQRALDLTAQDALRESRSDVEAALGELRAVARGTYPVLLDSGGLRPTLQALGRRSGVVVTVHDPGPGQLPPAGAVALCGLVEELADSGVTGLTVEVAGTDRALVTIVGGTPASGSLNLDRIAASGGIVEVVPGRTIVRFS